MGRQPVTIVRAAQMQFVRALRYDSGRVDLRHREIDALDRIEIGQFSYAGPLIEFAQVIRQVFEFVNVLAITFEVSVIDHVEADKCGEQPPVSFSDPFPAKIPAIISGNVITPEAYPAIAVKIAAAATT